MNSKDAAVIKALEELGLRKETDPSSLSPQLQDLQRQLDQYDQEIGEMDPETLKKYLIKQT